MKKALNIVNKVAGFLRSDEDKNKTLEKICKFLSKNFSTSIVSIYRNEDFQYRLIANHGFKKDYVGKLKISKGQGLVDYIISKKKNLCLRDATTHHYFFYVKGIGEEKFHGFTGIPIISQNHVVGALLVQYVKLHDSSNDEIALLETVAQQLSSLVPSSRAKKSSSSAKAKTKAKVDGRGVMAGLFYGEVIRNLKIDGLMSLSKEKKGMGYEVEKKRLLKAHKISFKFLTTLKNNAKSTEVKDILSAHLTMLTDPLLEKKEDEHLKNNCSAEQSVQFAVREISEAFEKISDPYIRQRATDVMDIGHRIFHSLSTPDKNPEETKQLAVYVASKLPPSVLIEGGRETFGALILVDESLYSHNIILAKSLGIPTVVISGDQSKTLISAQNLLVDGEKGRIFIDPSKLLVDQYIKTHAQKSTLTLKSKLKSLKTQDGCPITLGVNGCFVRDVENLPSWVDEVGLYRTEFQFFLSAKIPDEDEQTKTYSDVLKSVGGRPVTLRILDVGGDKKPPCMHFKHEDNPVLGDRSIRSLLKSNSDILFTQLRAMIKAQTATKGQLRILIPMVTIYEEVSRLRDHIIKVIRDLKNEGLKPKMPKIGVMIEVPASVNLIPRLNKIVDFFCVGTNDLLQYFMASDRNNTEVGYLCRWYHPSFLLTLRGVARSCQRNKKSVSVCGEMAGELWGCLVLVGLGYDNLSMDKKGLPRHHELLSKSNKKDLAGLSRDLSSCGSSLEILEKCQTYLDNWKRLSSKLRGVLQNELTTMIHARKD